MTELDRPSYADTNRVVEEKLHPLLDVAMKTWNECGPPDQQGFQHTIMVAFGVALGAGYRLGKGEKV